MSKIAVVAPVYITNDNHYALAQATMNSVFSREHTLDRIALVNKLRSNGQDAAWVDQNFNYVQQNDLNILSRAWNKGIDRAFERGAEYALVINLDLVFHPECIDRMVKLAIENPEPVIWSGTMWTDLNTLTSVPLEEETLNDVHFSCFLCDRRLFQLVGRFDEQFVPIYHEDCDMRRRIKLLQYKMLSIHSSRFYHVECGTLKCSAASSDKESYEELSGGLDTNRQRYIQKWGGPPYREVFTQPYNGTPPSQPAGTLG